MMKNVKYLIVGAGISGLTLAANLRGDDYLIIEKDNCIGGLCKTFYKDGYVWDCAGHFFHFATQEGLSEFKEDMHDNDFVVCKKTTNIYLKGRHIDYPFQANIHQLEKEDFIDCLYYLYFRNRKAEYENFEDMLYGKFGKGITDLFLRPYNEKLYACKINSLDTDSMGRFFPYVDLKQIISNMRGGGITTYNSIFEYPKKGANFYIDIIARRVNSDNIKLNTELLSIDIDKKEAITSKGDVIKYDYVINTGSLKRFVSMISNNCEYKNTSDYVLTSNKVLVFNIGFDLDCIDKATQWTYFPGDDVNFYRIGFYNNILKTNKMSLYVEIGFSEHDEIDVESEFEKAISGLKRIGVINDHKVLSYNYLIIDPGYVHITKNSIDYANKIRHYLMNKGVYSIGRYGMWTYCSIEDCVVSAKKLAKSFLLFE